MMIERIGGEHGYMRRLLAILNENVTLLKTEQAMNYALIKEVVDYLSSHSERVHHPKEDLMYHYYNEHYGVNEKRLKLAEEHEKLSDKTHAFLETVEMVLNDVVVPKEVFITQLESFITAQLDHLDMEERYILPKLEATFTPKDWQYLESQWFSNDADPVFGEAIENRYRQLTQLIQSQTIEA